MSAVRKAALSVWHVVAWVWNHSIGFVLTWALIIVIRIYQLTLSKVLPPSCRYYPSCSAYGLESMKVHGALKGTVLTVWRLGRCNPWNDGGIDPVPPPGRWIPDVDRLGNPRSETMGAHHSADTNV